MQLEEEVVFIYLGIYTQHVLYTHKLYNNKGAGSREGWVKEREGEK